MSRAALSLVATAALTIAALAACREDRTAATGPAIWQSPGQFQFFDDTRDTLATDLRFQNTIRAIDVRELSGVFGRDTLLLTLRFAGEVRPPQDLAPNSVIAIVDIDADRNAQTGGVAFADRFLGGHTELGVDYEITVPDTTGTAAGLYSVALNEYTILPVHVAGDSLTLRVPLTRLGTVDTDIDIAALVGTLERPTDVAPNDRHYTVSRPRALTRISQVRDGRRLTGSQSIPALAFTAFAPAPADLSTSG